MILVNFSHPLSADQVKQLEALLDHAPIERIIEVHSQIDPAAPLGPQVSAMIDQAGLSPEEWQNTPIIINPPSLNFSAVLLIAELHGRMGFFPACVRLRAVNGAIPPRFEVAEVLNLQAQRNTARHRRA